MISIAVIGAQGYVGKSICDALYSLNAHNDGLVAVFPVVRGNYEEAKNEKYDIIINSAMPSGRFWAQENPGSDFRETVKMTADLLYGWDYNKIIQISSLSARCEKHLVYGRHKALAEELCFYAKNYLIVRLTAMYSDNISKGALFDILHSNKVFSSRDSRFAFTSLEFVGQWVAHNLGEFGLVEVGAKNTISLDEISSHLKKDIVFGSNLQVQEIQHPREDFPDARDVLEFMDRMSHDRA